ncbi:MAG: LPXTG cell wall anchor domain-containing protein [Acidobacteriota bacterium]|nr:LPXTG cell wall anchor domain-containing protein [Acidobacteriota bacterium]
MPRPRFQSLLVVLLTALSMPLARSQSNNGQTVKVTNQLEIPDGSLAPGTYKFALEDRLDDRAIIRITAKNSDTHYILLAVPNKRLQQATLNGLITYKPGDSGQNALRAWECPNCDAPLEFVYPKLQAVKLTGDFGTPVLAIDPTYDKLPANLSRDDMKVVTLWLVSPKRIVEGKGEGVGVDAAKLSVARPQAPNVQLAANRKRLPKTASNFYELGFGGVLLMVISILLYVRRRAAEKL